MKAALLQGQWGETEISPQEAGEEITQRRRRPSQEGRRPTACPVAAVAGVSVHLEALFCAQAVDTRRPRGCTDTPAAEAPLRRPTPDTRTHVDGTPPPERPSRPATLSFL